MNNKEKQNKEKSSRGVSKIAAIIGFSLVGLAALTLICTMLITFISSNNMVSESELSTFKNEKEIEARLKTVIKNSGKLYSSDANYIKDIIGSPQPLSDTSDSIVDGDQAVIGQASYSDVSSEDEADTVKTDDRYIYFLSSGGSKISIFSAEGEKSKLVSEINITNKETETFQFADFFLKGKKLIAVEEAKVSVSAEDARAYTRVEVFDLSDIQKIKPAESFIQSGAYSASRMTDDILYIVSTHHAANEKDLPCAVYGDKTVSTDDKNNPDRIPAEDIYSVDEPDEPNFTV
ncbi:MAG: beta-propeller domain-containing protein, partial [Ruminococcus sp.]|nr:beta-propeller domain-containing protein [Ruminococcus sp.]